MACVYWPYSSYKENKWVDFNTTFIEFLPLALLDWADRLIFTIGLSQVSSSLPPMIRGMIPPIAACLSYFLFNRKFGINKILAISVTILGITLGCFVQMYYQTEEEAKKSTIIGILLLVLSAFTQAA